ncbi:MAG: hypothetical protein K2Z81_08060 [Cyanobacteria bacterium]|nr:hypothetical protein [Cyanobacteriota bacterium]
MEGKSKLEMLDDLYIAAPCAVPWESMTGDDRVRQCSGCSKNVYNISNMTKEEAVRLFAESNVTPCIRLSRRADGTIITDNCPVGLRKLRDRSRQMIKFVAGIASGMIAALLSIPAAIANDGLSTSCADRTGSKATDASPYSKKGVTGTREFKFETPRSFYVTVGAIVPPKPKRRAVAITGGAPAPMPINDFRESPMSLQRSPHDIRGPHSVTEEIDSVRYSDKGLLRLKAELNMVADSRAYMCYTVAKDYESRGNIVQAMLCYKRALEAFDEQKAQGDPKFRELIEHDLAQLAARDSSGMIDCAIGVELDSEQHDAQMKRPGNKNLDVSGSMDDGGSNEK